MDRTPPRSELPATTKPSCNASLSLLMLGLFSLALATERLDAQSTTPRHKFVFHVYVDPLFGDDALAMQFNPNGTAVPTPPGPLSLHPHFDNDSGSPTYGTHPITGHLQHAPYPFRTLSGPNGALAYVDMRVGPLPSGGDPMLTHVVIHCLPGLYGPLLTQSIDPVSGLPFNGEQFPIVLDQDHVSIQGTSSLDTIFDARQRATSIVQVWRRAPMGIHQDEFIDGIGFRNAVAGTAVGSGAAIWIRGLVLFDPNNPEIPQQVTPADVTVTNCTFEGNAVGIAVDASAVIYEMNSLFAAHRPVIFNNTFAWNSIGIWEGNLGAAVAPVLIQHLSAIANNLFDLARPPGFPVALSCFEGVQSFEREVTLRGSVSLLDPITSQGRDFNAFPDLRNITTDTTIFFNNGATIGTFLVAAPTGPSSTQVAARVDLTSLTPTPGSGLVRTLFVSDAMRNASNGVNSDHDLRLCPNVGSPSVGGQPSALTLNPCVNMGIDAGFPPTLDIRFRSGRTLCSGMLGLPSYSMPPSAACTMPNPPADVEEAPISGWDFDTEGFGNERIVTPAGYPPSPDGLGNIDIGADEIDDLIQGGFVNGTRILTGPAIPNTSGGHQDHTRVFFFGLIGSTMPRPTANTMLGRLFPWYEHVQDGPGLMPPDLVSGNFTDGSAFDSSSISLRHIQVSGGVPRRHTFPRNLECDFSGHLTSDFHPLWGMLTATLGSPFPGDGYASNPWFDTFDLSGPPYKRLWNSWPDLNALSDNQALYHNRGAALPHQTAWTIQHLLPGVTFVLSGHLNPPLTFPPFATGQSWLIATFGTAQFGPFGSCTGSVLTFGAFCFDDQPGGCPDIIPEFPGEGNLGRRFNLEPTVAAGMHRNLQTYLQIFPTELNPASPFIGGEFEQLLLPAAAREMTERSERGGAHR